MGYPDRRGLDPAPVLTLLRGKTSTEAGAMCDVSPQTIRNWRIGRNGIHRDMADQIATNLGTHTSVLWPTGLEPPARCPTCGR